MLEIDRTTIGQLIDNLAAKDFIRRQQNPKDRRQNLILLTDEGACPKNVDSNEKGRGANFGEFNSQPGRDDLRNGRKN